MRRALLIAGLALGAGLALLAVLATALGIDHDASWGAGRMLLFAGGLGIAALALGLLFEAWLTRLLPMRAREAAAGIWRHRLPLLALLCGALALTAYAFFETAGTWTTWPEVSRYYNDLGAAFRAGRLDLGVQPSPALLAMSDPYDPQARNADPQLREFVDTVWDLAFYKDKFYLYWGPAPAAILALIKLIDSRPVPDQYLVFACLAGLLLFTILLIVRLHRRLSPETPVFLVATGILTAALAVPVLWLAGRAAIYEATIASGQLFLISGLYFAVLAIERRPTSRAWLLVAAVLWALASASRTLMLVPAAFLTAMSILWLSTDALRTKVDKTMLPGALVVAIPLLAAIGGVAWYNWARFGSAFETGLRYTLTFHNLDKYYGETFSALHVLPSLWMYLLNPLELSSRFPFVGAPFGRAPSVLYIGETSIYHVDELTGVLFSVPFVLFSVIPIVNAVRAREGANPPLRDGDQRKELTWVSFALAGSGLLSFGAILFYFNVTMRFLGEFIPALMLLAALGVWQGYDGLRNRPALRRLFVLIVLLVSLFTILVGVMLAFSGSMTQFQRYNPHLVKQLTAFFSR